MVQRLTYAGINDTKTCNAIYTQPGINNSTIVVARSHFGCARRMINRKSELNPPKKCQLALHLNARNTITESKPVEWSIPNIRQNRMANVGNQGTVCDATVNQSVALPVDRKYCKRFEFLR